VLDGDASFGVDAQPVTVSAMITAIADCLAISSTMGHSGDTCCSRTRDLESRVGSAISEAVAAELVYLPRFRARAVLGGILYDGDFPLLRPALVPPVSPEPMKV
jgi:hypothetical protein